MNKHYIELIKTQIALALSRSKSAELLKHKGQQGRAREVFLHDLLRPLIPVDLDVCTGVVVDSRGSQSRQVDLIVYNKRLVPPILWTTGEAIVPCESVLACIEVKSTLSAEELKKAVDNARSLKHLKPEFNEPKPVSPHKSSIFCSVFAYQSKRLPKNEVRLLQRLAREANSGKGPKVHVPISALCVNESCFALAQIQDPEHPEKHTFRFVTKEPLVTFLGYLRDELVFLAAERTPTYFCHYLQ